MNTTPSQSNSQQCSREFVVSNEFGLHARPAALFVKTTNRFKSEIVVEKSGESVNGKSIMGLMMLAAGKGAVLKIIATGADASAALDAIEEIFKLKFNEQ